MAGKRSVSSWRAAESAPVSGPISASPATVAIKACGRAEKIATSEAPNSANSR